MSSLPILQVAKLSGARAGVDVNFLVTNALFEIYVVGLPYGKITFFSKIAIVRGIQPSIHPSIHP